MARNKVVLRGGQTLIDLTADTVTAETLRKGYTAHDKSGALITGTLEVETTPIGTVIYYAGKAAPEGYLACDGTVYNISAYPALAAFFQTNYGSKNYWGGNGSSTFAVPDWQGEFFRAAGTQSREDQGSGAAVGAHQNATQHLDLMVDSAFYVTINRSSNNTNRAVYADSRYGDRQGRKYVNASQWENWEAQYPFYTSRPTNTSLLVCIKY